MTLQIKKDRKTKKKSDADVAEDKPKVKKKRKTEDKTISATSGSSELPTNACAEQPTNVLKERKKKRSGSNPSSTPSPAVGLQEKSTKKTDLGKVIKSEKKMLRAKERRKAQKKARKEKMKVRKAKKLAAAKS